MICSNAVGCLHKLSIVNKQTIDKTYEWTNITKRSKVNLEAGKPKKYAHRVELVVYVSFILIHTKYKTIT